MMMIQDSAMKFFLLSSTVIALANSTSVKMDYLPIGHARVDPILRDDCVSDHVHTFYGPQSGVDPRRIDSSDELELHRLLLNTDVSENTGNVEENKSLYWHPTVYKYDKDKDEYTRDAMAQTSAYYVWETGEATAFPDGFRMIGGFDIEKSQANAECVNPRSCKSGDCFTENDFFPVDRCDELEVSMRMPNCWDGVSIESPPDHTSHVAYARDGEFDGRCPSSHPVRLPQIHLFFRIFDYDGGWHTFSDGSGVFHADYVSGWDEEFLQDLLDECDNDGFGPMPNFFCEDFLTFRDSPKCTDEDECDFADPNLLEKIREFQPDPLDIAGTIAVEETRKIEGDLPRGTCKGSFVGDNGNNNSRSDDSDSDSEDSSEETPTKKPTKKPTSKTTSGDSKKPTPKPTRKSNKPTKKPTMSPTIPLTNPPTNPPSQSPTKSPSMRPTMRPTMFPTKNPTVTPTAVPTNSDYPSGSSFPSGSSYSSDSS